MRRCWRRGLKSAGAVTGRMPTAPGPLPPARIQEDPRLAAELAGRLAAASHDLAIAATDLVAPRIAYWRRYAPRPAVPEERRARQERGRSWHRTVAERLPEEGAYEVRVRRRGVIARIDLLADVPVEIKSGAAVAVDDLPGQRPEHLEQLGIYCSLLDRTQGRVVHLAPAPGDGMAVGAVDIDFSSEATLAGAVDRRLRQLRTAILTKSPVELPRCRWWSRGCEYGDAGTCDCSGAEPPPPDDLLSCAGTLTRRPDIEARWSERLATEPDPVGSPTVGRYRDLIYPRRTYFDRTTPTGGAPGELAARPVPIGSDLYDRLQEALEGGPAGEVARLPDRGERPEEEVAGFRGEPYLVRTSRAWDRIRPTEAGVRFPQYLLELGFRCAATGVPEGVVVVAFEHAETDADRIEVLRYHFPDLGAFRREWESRREALARAIAEHAPAELSPCPAWMFEECPYRAACGCGTPARSQR